MHVRPSKENSHDGLSLGGETIQGKNLSAFSARKASPQSGAHAALQAMVDHSARAHGLRAIQAKLQGNPRSPDANQTVQLQAYRKAPWTNAALYTNTGPYLERIEGRDWMNSQTLQSYPHIQQAELDAARGGAGPAATMAASNGAAWRDYAPPGARWAAAVDPSHTVLSLRSLSAHLVLAKVDAAWGSTNVGEQDIRHLSTHSGAYPGAHRHAVMPPGGTINAASMDTLAAGLAERGLFDAAGAGGFKWAKADAGQRLAMVTTWSGNLAANLL